MCYWQKHWNYILVGSEKMKLQVNFYTYIYKTKRIQGKWIISSLFLKFINNIWKDKYMELHLNLWLAFYSIVNIFIKMYICETFSEYITGIWLWKNLESAAWYQSPILHTSLTFLIRITEDSSQESIKYLVNWSIALPAVASYSFSKSQFK